MSLLLSKVSIADSSKKSESIRNITRDYFIQAARLFTPKNRPSCEIHDEEKYDNGMNRYYQMKVNSLIDLEHDDIEYIVKCSSKSINCLKCGATKKLALRTRRAHNKSSKRKHCKYLRTICDLYCDSCYSTNHGNKLLGRSQIIDKLQQRQQARSSPSKLDKAKRKRKKKTRPIDINIADKIDESNKNTGQLDRAKVTTSTLHISHTRDKPVSRNGSRPDKVRSKPKLVKLPPSKIVSQTKPQFSSRLRSFTCLLEE